MKTCPNCMREFEPKRSEQTYCSHQCSVRANRNKFDFGFSHIGYVRYKF